MWIVLKKLTLLHFLLFLALQMHIVSVDFCVDKWCQRRQTFSWEGGGVQRMPTGGDVDSIHTTLVPVWGSRSPPWAVR